MRVLLDENVDPRLAPHLSEFDVSTVRGEGWAAVRNGELLLLVEPRFNALVTRDKGLPHQ